MLVVTTEFLVGWQIVRVCGEVFGSSVRPPAIGPDDAVVTALVDARTDAVARMVEHARVKDGNAVVGFRFESSALAGERTEVCAYGTAVVAVPVDDGARHTAAGLGYRLGGQW